MANLPLAGVPHASRMAHGAVRLGCRVVPGEQWSTSGTVPVSRAGYMLGRHVDRTGRRFALCSSVRHFRASRSLLVTRRMDHHPCGTTCLDKAPQGRCRPNVRVPRWHSTQRISQFENQPGRLRSRWLASQQPGPLPLPRFLRDSRLLQGAGGPCDFRLHSQWPLARAQAAAITSGVNSNPAPMPALYHASPL